MTGRETRLMSIRRELELRGYTLKRSKNGLRICDSTGFPVKENLETLDDVQNFINEKGEF